jgi:hypothetical protein
MRTQDADVCRAADRHRGGPEQPTSLELTGKTAYVVTLGEEIWSSTTS